AGTTNVGGVLQAAQNGATGTLAQQAVGFVGTGLINAGVSTVFNGGSFGNALKGSLVAQAAALGANSIGANTDPGSLESIASHAALGCVAGAAGSGDCASGAIGGATSAMLAPDVIRMIDPTGAPLSPGQTALVTALSMLAGGGLAAALSQNATAAASAAQNEALNNATSGDHPASAAKNGGMLSAFGTWLQNTYRDPIGDLSRWGNQLIGTMVANNGQTPQSDPNPLIDVSNGGNPPATGAAVVTPPVVACGPTGCIVTPGIVSPGAPGYVPGNAILSSGNGGNGASSDTSGNASASNTSGDAARLVGQDRETAVANIVKGSVSGEKVAVPGLGSTDIDVVAANGNLVAVGGPAKANNLGKLGQELRIYQAIADQRGVSAQAYFAEGTPQSAINLATKILGAGNVKVFPGSQ
ncbi:DUF637 domain-containing protein, partial [Cupriavidus basilensis]|uniref:DUF637 domain-containing protein n=1 Tax=Cupriavidus basilensis TaxID=68895 RepID=UPI00157A427A